MPYKLSDFGEIEKPQAEYSSVQPGRIITDIPQSLIDRLKTIGGGRFNDASRQDSSDITALLRHGLKPWDVYATFAASPRGKDAYERKSGHFDDYMQRTIRNSLAYLNPDNQNFESSPAVQKAKTNGHSRKLDIDFSRRRNTSNREGIHVTMAHTIEIEKTHWLWDGYIPAGKITILAGDPGRGKSTIAIDIAARISRGAALPFSGRTISGGCLLASAEDAPEDTIKPRLIAAGADLKKAGIMREVVIDGEHKLLSFPRDIDRLRDKIIELGARLVVIDPLTAFLGAGSDSYKDQDIRAALAPVEFIAQETSAAILIIAHKNKRQEADIMYRVGGSIGLVGAARSVLAVDEMPDKRLVMHSVKSNLSRKPLALAYRTRGVSVDKEFGVTSSRIQWLGKINFDPSNTLGTDARKGLNEAREFILKVLADGPIRTKEIFAEAKQVGIGRPILSQIKTELGVKIEKDRSGEWTWGL